MHTQRMVALVSLFLLSTVILAPAGCSGESAADDDSRCTDEVCDGVDNDCDGAVDEGFDVDGDGVLSCGGDCDDADPARYPGGVDVAYDGVDQDCDGKDLLDVDGDGHDALQAGGDDCDDSSSLVYPGAGEVCDGADNDCDGAVDSVTEPRSGQSDDDGDGYCLYHSGRSVCLKFVDASTCKEGEDCDDTKATAYPGAAEVCRNNVDEDCDGLTDENPPCY